MLKEKHHNGNGAGTPLTVASIEVTRSLWPTATVNDARGGRNQTSERSDPNSSHHDGVTLCDAITMWPTPNVPNGGRVNKREDVESKGATPNGKVQIDLGSAARYWPTPNAQDGPKGGPNQKHGRGDGHLPAVTAQWPTPQHADGERMSEAQVRGNPTLLGAARAAVDEAQPKKRLNPLFVEWLQGVPENWTCVCILTDATTCQCPRTARLSSLGNAVVPAQAAYAFVTLVAELALCHVVSHGVSLTHAAT